MCAAGAGIQIGYALPKRYILILYQNIASRRRRRLSSQAICRSTPSVRSSLPIIRVAAFRRVPQPGRSPWSRAQLSNSVRSTMSFTFRYTPRYFTRGLRCFGCSTTMSLAAGLVWAAMPVPSRAIFDKRLGVLVFKGGATHEGQGSESQSRVAGVPCSPAL